MIPTKPFPEFKWRWLSTTPTEGLLVPPVFLGVLRALATHEGVAPSSPELLESLAKVQADTNTGVNLVRTPDRNLIRNSGQYWKGTGLIKPQSGVIQLSNLGWQVATSELSQDEFAALIIHQTELPNRNTFPEALYQKWLDAGIRVKPFVLILEVITCLGKEAGDSQAYITEEELVKIIVPLSGNSQPPSVHAEHIIEHRNGNLNLSAWPSCCEAANDKRMAREFLYFLANYDVCAKNIVDEELRYCLTATSQIASISDLDVATDQDALNTDDGAADAVERTRHSELPSIIERQRTTTTVINRPNQSKFRKEVLTHADNICVITGDTIPKVLEAAHIIPVTHGGTDNLDNGFCMRVDIHRLYDSSLIRILPNGTINVSSSVRSSPGYSSLPSSITIPAHVNPANMEWRNSYC